MKLFFLNNNNNKFIRITIKEKIYDETTIKNIFWIRNKKYYNNDNNKYSIFLNKRYIII